ncbi:MAG: DegQ family serine endoprotease [Gammaproteobacteria bacterium]
MRTVAVIRTSLVVLAAWLTGIQGGLGAVELPDFTELVERNSPGVVNISTSKERQVSLPPGMEMPDIPEDSPFGDFMRRFFGERGEGMERFNPQSLGSGFVFSDDGYIITNHHVVKDASEIIVKLSDRRELVAEFIGGDPRSDIALLKVDASDLPVLNLGNSDDVKVGEWVLAIGSPFGFDHSVTAGIVSAKGRSLPSENYVPFIQTDVAINPGNSGGPLFDLDGRVIGINSQIYSRTGGFMGLSFAIPIEVALDVADQLKSDGKVSRGWLGVFIQEVTRELAESFGMEKPTGALVARVLPRSPAEDSGVQTGDIILSFAGDEVADSAALPPMVGRTKIGDEVPLEIMRDGTRSTVDVRIGKLPDQDPLTLSGPVTPDASQDAVFGLKLKELSSEEREQSEVQDGGLIVQQVEEGPAKAAGIRQGDLVLKINNEEIKNLEGYNNLVKDLPKGKFASVLIQRDSNAEFIAIKVPG